MRHAIVLLLPLTADETDCDGLSEGQVGVELCDLSSMG